MLELIAQGKTLDTRWRRTLPEFPVELGRATESYRVPWDQQVSRRHVRLEPRGHRVHVTRLPSAVNPVFYNGCEQDEFDVQPGEHFVIGSTTFLVTADQAFGSLQVPDPISQKTFTADFLQQVSYRDADRRLEVLNRIPKVIASADDPEELLIRMVNLLMAGIVNATTIGVVRWSPENPQSRPSSPINGPTAQAEDSLGHQTVGFFDTVSDSSSTGPESQLQVIHWDRRGFDRGDFQPSETLVRQAIDSQQTVLNVWHTDQLPDSGEDPYTFDYENDWAFACPMLGPATDRWAIYVAGRNRLKTSDRDASENEPDDSQPAADVDGDIKFCELVGSTLKNLLQVKRLERQEASLRTFFSPIVIDAIRGRDPDQVLTPRECYASVLFCDLRGFSKTSEQLSDDLLGLLQRVSAALGVMTSAILDASGVIGDFHGDAVMGFWGWPLDTTSDTDIAHLAVQTAQHIEAVFASDESITAKDDKASFPIGIGIASGHAVAGKIGTRDQGKVTVFGPVVNLASRLEGMTRLLSSSILIDEATARHLENLETSVRTRRIGNFLPWGMSQPVNVFQVLPADTELPVETYAEALQAFEQGSWSECRKQLAPLVELDGTSKFLWQQLGDADEAPESFAGVIQLQSK